MRGEGDERGKRDIDCLFFAFVFWFLFCFVFVLFLYYWFWELDEIAISPLSPYDF